VQLDPLDQTAVQVLLEQLVIKENRAVQVLLVAVLLAPQVQQVLLAQVEQLVFKELQVLLA
jgi:hypothetical protein